MSSNAVDPSSQQPSPFGHCHQPPAQPRSVFDGLGQPSAFGQPRQSQPVSDFEGLGQAKPTLAAPSFIFGQPNKLPTTFGVAANHGTISQTSQVTSERDYPGYPTSTPISNFPAPPARHGSKTVPGKKSTTTTGTLGTTNPDTNVSGRIASTAPTYGPGIFGQTNISGGVLEQQVQPAASPFSSTTGTPTFRRFGQKNLPQQLQRPSNASEPASRQETLKKVFDAVGPTAQSTSTPGKFGQTPTVAAPPDSGQQQQQQPHTGGSGIFNTSNVIPKPLSGASKTATQQPESIFGGGTSGTNAQQPPTGLSWRPKNKQPASQPAAGLFGRPFSFNQNNQGAPTFSPTGPFTPKPKDSSTTNPEEESRSPLGNAMQNQVQPSAGLFGQQPQQQNDRNSLSGTSSKSVGAPSGKLPRQNAQQPSTGLSQQVQNQQQRDLVSPGALVFSLTGLSPGTFVKPPPFGQTPQQQKQEPPFEAPMGASSLIGNPTGQKELQLERPSPQQPSSGYSIPAGKQPKAKIKKIAVKLPCRNFQQSQPQQDPTPPRPDSTSTFSDSVPTPLPHDGSCSPPATCDNTTQPPYPDPESTGHHEDVPQPSESTQAMTEGREEVPASGFIDIPLKNDITSLISVVQSIRIALGGFGDVFLGNHKDLGKIALKRPHNILSEASTARFLREVALWCSVSHKYILPCLGTCKVGLDVYIVSPFIQNGDLLSCMKRGKDLDRNRLLYEVAEALAHLHYIGIIHGDIKAQNILLADDGSARLCDFGLAKVFDTTVTSTASKGIGSVRWMAPELFADESRSMASDVYSFGITIAEVLSCCAPYPNISSNIAVARHVERGERPAKDPLSSPEGKSYATLWATAEKCWVKDSKGRPHMAQVLGILFPLTRGTPEASPTN